jgi:hypothetical protein
LNAKLAQFQLTVGVTQFKTSLVARRFPGIKGLSEEDIAILVLSERKSRGETRTLPQKTYPKTQFQPMSPRRNDPEATQPPPKFIPCNPSQAKATIVMPPVQASTLLCSTNGPEEVHQPNVALSDHRRVNQHAAYDACVAAHPVACTPRIFADGYRFRLLCIPLNSDKVMSCTFSCTPKLCMKLYCQSPLLAQPIRQFVAQQHVQGFLPTSSLLGTAEHC